MTDATDLLRSYFHSEQTQHEHKRAVDERAVLMRKAAVQIIENPEFLKPDWVKYRNQFYPLPLITMFALSVGINPDIARFEECFQDAILGAAIDTKNEDIHRRITEYQSRFDMFYASEGHPATPVPWHEKKYPHRPLLRPVDFANWAVSVGWDLPEEFPGQGCPSEGLVTEERLLRSCVATRGEDDSWRSHYDSIKRKDNLWRAIGEALESGEIGTDCTASDFMEYLAKKDESGYVLRKNGDSISWINTSGEESVTKLDDFNKRLLKLRNKPKK